MTRHRIERAAITALGFVAGSALAVCIAPGDVVLWAAAGIVLAIFCHAFFVRGLGGEVHWPWSSSHRSLEKKIFHR